MYVSQISGLNSPNYIRTQKKSAKTSGNVNFGSAYTAAFDEAISKKFWHVNPELCNTFVDLFSKLKSHPDVTVNSIINRCSVCRFKDMDSLFQNIFSGNLGEYIVEGECNLAIKNSTGNTLAWASRLDNAKELGVFHPDGERFMQLTMNDKGLTTYSLERYLAPQSIDKLEYYGNSLHCHTTVNGDKVSTTVYDEYGNVNRVGTFAKKWFGWLGI